MDVTGRTMNDNMMWSLVAIIVALTSPEPPGVGHQLFIPIIERQPMSSKRGLATHHPEVMTDARLLDATWRYDWLPDTPTAPYVESVPMVYSPYVLMQLILGACELGGNSLYLMGFNEPDRPDQANVVPTDAVVYWLLLEMLYPNRLLVSPAPSHLYPEWLAEFRAEFIKLTGHPPRFDALAIHCYFSDDADSCKAVVEQVIKYAQDWDVPGGVWVTEFGPACSAAGFDASKSASEARAFIQWMDENPYVTRYAWFPTRLDGSEYWRPNLRDWAPLVDGDGRTHWGWVYIGVVP